MQFFKNNKFDKRLSIGILCFGVFLVNFYFVKLVKQSKTTDVRVLGTYAGGCSSYTYYKGCMSAAACTANYAGTATDTYDCYASGTYCCVGNAPTSTPIPTAPLCSEFASSKGCMTSATCSTYTNPTTVTARDCAAAGNTCCIVTAADSAVCTQYGNCSGNCTSANSCTSSSSCISSSAVCGGITYPSYACSSPASCAAGWTTTVPTDGLYTTCVSQCSCCSNKGPTCYQVTQTGCKTNGYNCYSNTCTNLNGSASSYIYASQTGYCSTGYCCSATAKTACTCTGQANYPSGYSYTVSGDTCLTATCTGTSSCVVNPNTGLCCTAGDVVAGGWSSYTYGSWSTCSSCSRSRTGTRTCTNPAPFCGGATCSGSATITETDSTACAVNGTWSAWSNCTVACGTCTQSRTCTGTACGGATCSGSATQTVDLGCCPVNGTTAVCGTAAGVTSFATPTTNLCSTGTASIVSAAASSYSWTCYGLAGSCGGLTGVDALCSAPRAQAPSFSGIEVRNTSNAVVAAESGNQNQINQSVFTDKKVRFVVTGTDPNGNDDITSIQLRIGGNVYSPNSLSNGVAIFDIAYSSGNSSSSSVTVESNITDSSGQSTGWINTNRSFKFWDGKVSINGTLYDGSYAVFEVIDCSSGSSDFTTPVSSKPYNLTFTGVSGDTDKVMSVSSPGYSGGSNKLTWGAQYRATFSGLDGSTPVMRYPGNNTCNSTSGSFTVDSSSQIGLDPYAANPTLTINFSSILSQFAWYQVAGSGILAKNTIIDNIPNTCVDPCKPNISVGTTESSDSLIAALSITKGSGSFGEVNNWSISKDVIGTSYGYKYFYNEYFVKLGQGKAYGVGKSMSQIIAETGGTGVVFVNGRVTIDTDNVVPIGNFFMVVSSGDIEIMPTVNNFQGILISDGNITAGGTSENQLRIDGSLYATENDIKFTRGFTVGTFNNRNPAVVITYRPDFIFSMPGKLTKILSGWKEGI